MLISGLLAIPLLKPVDAWSFGAVALAVVAANVESTKERTPVNEINACVMTFYDSVMGCQPFMETPSKKCTNTSNAIPATPIVVVAVITKNATTPPSCCDGCEI
jgi:hypothetical protein